jgi:hypothetical protein
MGWEKKSAEKIEFSEKGMVVEGRLLGLQRLERLGINSYTMSVVDENGEDSLIAFLGTTVLDRLLPDEIGNLVRLTYTGEQKTSAGYKVKQFEVEVYREEEPAEVEII